MEKVVELTISKKEDLYEKYNQNIIAKDLINYLIENTDIEKEDTVKIVIYNKSEEKNYQEKIKKSLKNEYEQAQKEYQKNNKVQLVYLGIGAIFICLSILFRNHELFEELFLIGGWVLVGGMFEIEVFSDTANKQKRLILKKLLESTMVEKK